MRKTLIAVFYLVAAVVIGALVAAATAQIPFLSWLAFGKSIGIPAVGQDRTVPRAEAVQA